MTRRKRSPEPGGLGTSHARRTLRTSRAQQMEEGTSKEGDASPRFQQKRHRKQCQMTGSAWTGIP
eukprot:9538435-Heterocapsa_arctica.AAC.1